MNDEDQNRKDSKDFTEIRPPEANEDIDEARQRAIDAVLKAGKGDNQLGPVPSTGSKILDNMDKDEAKEAEGRKGDGKGGEGGQGQGGQQGGETKEPKEPREPGRQGPDRAGGPR